MTIRAVVCDIEGTTTSLSFARDVLFPISFQEMDQFISQHWDGDVAREELNQIKRGIAASRAVEPHTVTVQEVIERLKEWIRQDKKEPALKSIQGKIWRHSFEKGLIQGHVYLDVPVNFEKWKASGISINIFSSGSIEAQQLIFRYSEKGDLTTFIDRYFDTSIGPKKESSSYRAIADAIGHESSLILFFSDVVEELDAAAEAGMQTIHVVREANIHTGNHKAVRTFDEVPL